MATKKRQSKRHKGTPGRPGSSRRKVSIKAQDKFPRRSGRNKSTIPAAVSLGGNRKSESSR